MTKLINSCGISNLLEEADMEGMLALTLAYMYEKSLGKESPWFEYLETIEEVSEATIPRFWTLQEQEWLVGSEVEYMGGLDASEVSGVYEEEVKPFIEANHLFENSPKLKTLESYRDALVAVSGRAFEVDVYRGLSLVPGACLFNHTNDEDVHFESQDAVCPVCGDANFCEHALEHMQFDEHEHAHSHENGECGGHDHSHSHSHTGSSKDEKPEETELTEEGISDESEEEDDGFEDIEEDEDVDEDEDEEMEDAEFEEKEGDAEEDEEDEEEDEEVDTCDIISVKNIPAGKEVYNTYGELSNGVLLSRYGFALWDNVHETVSLGKELLSYVKENNLKKRTAWWAENFYRLIFGIDPEDWSEDMTDPEDEDDETALPPPSPDSITWLEILDIFSNGVPSPGLMAILYLLSLSQDEYDAFVAKVEGGDYDSISFNNRGLALLKSLVEIRAKRYADGGMSSSDCLKLLDTLQSDPSKSRESLALIVRGTEKLVIERTLSWIEDASKKGKKGKKGKSSK